jgi:hypothetical protein
VKLSACAVKVTRTGDGAAVEVDPAFLPAQDVPMSKTVSATNDD